MEQLDTKTMHYNLEVLMERTIDTIKLSDLKRIQDQMAKIKGETFCLGAGGSEVVADFAAKVLNFKNNCVTTVGDAADLCSINLKPYKNVLACSYSGNNYGVEVALNCGLKGYLLTNGELDGNTIRYFSGFPNERSYVSLGGTLMPMSILLSYYLEQGNIETLITEMFSKIQKFEIETDDNFHIFFDSGTSTIGTFLESTMVEGGLGRPICHGKYSYCHGRSVLLKKYFDSVIYCETKETDLDRTIKDAVHNYRQKIILKSDYNDPVLDNFFLVLQGIYLMAEMASLKGIDLSKIDYDKEAVSKLYRFRGTCGKF